jgi:outer membrane biosynthesis protein TonB
MRAWLPLLLLLLVSSLSLADSTPEVMSLHEAVKNHLLLRNVAPVYYYEARRRNIQGSGVFDLRFDYETGHLREVHIVNALPDPLLQKAAIDAYAQWQAKPRSIHVLRIPVTFRMRRPWPH